MPVNYNDCTWNAFSQSGEDGIIAALLERLPDCPRLVIEFGAGDGISLSNSRNLINHGWAAILIERDPDLYAQLIKTYPVERCLQETVGFTPTDSLDYILDKHKFGPGLQVGVLSVDIDGHDYQVWRTVTWIRPWILVIECNPTIPPWIEYVQPTEMADQRHGTSFLSMTKLCRDKGYELVAMTDFNAIYVAAEKVHRLDIGSHYLMDLWHHEPWMVGIWQTFDTELHVSGSPTCHWLVKHPHNLDFPALTKAINAVPPVALT